MPKSTDNKLAPDVGGTNPSVNPQTGAVNPSAPTVGTEQWGNTSDERRVLGKHDPADTRAGQMKGNPGDEMTAASQPAEQRATTNTGRGDFEQADLSGCTSDSAFSMKAGRGDGDRSFRCIDAGNTDCDFETSGDSEDAVMRCVEEHWRHNHGLSGWGDAMRARLRDNIRARKAA